MNKEAYLITEDDGIIKKEKILIKNSFYSGNYTLIYEPILISQFDIKSYFDFDDLNSIYNNFDFSKENKKEKTIQVYDKDYDDIDEMLNKLNNYK